MRGFGKKTFIPLFVITAMQVFFARCNPPQHETAEADKLRQQVYFTKEDPGRWKDFAKDHDPQLQILSAGKIVVDVPMVADTGHYIEVILAADAAGREIALKNFKRAEKPHAELEIQLEKRSGIAIIAKCNLHGMWRKELH
jgi:desulfoferrodoxin (superoxide reductase-like protein)